MAYTPIGWQTGDTITAEKMNKMDNGWGVQNTQLFSETATTVAYEYGNEAELTYAESITADSITVTFDGNEYTCPIVSMGEGQYGYGGVDSSWNYNFSEYPFAIVSENSINYFATQTAGTHTVAVSTINIEISDTFSTIVSTAVEPNLSTLPFLCVSGETTRDEFSAASIADRLIYFTTYGLHFAVGVSMSGVVSFFPEDADITAKFENNIFTVTRA